MVVDPLSSLPDEFDKWAERNILERIDMKICVGQAVRFPTTASAWARLNGLAIHNRFPNLRTVSLTVSLLKEESSNQTVKDELDSQQRQIFKDLIESDELAFKFSVQLHDGDAY
ncbi:hypothetical protein GALMADRAFT_240024 [Galerina marginata CBS 339.88]|uniref:Uncharacterized protein n=1 Tax=Galerina marginata (strain CBS 339.88) TaxID=685588 RepID=A0A067TEZ6_GALM3|nr:hypothetical protein GALMADRAFT_240024 [Galerina marginata CBS 339.88]